MIERAERYMSSLELKAKYDSLQPGNNWSEHPQFKFSDWVAAVSALDTLQGYWDWVGHEIDYHFIENDQPQPHSTKRIRLIVEVTAENEFAEGPEAAIIDVDERMLARITSLAAKVRSEGLTSISVSRSIEWFQNSEYKMVGDELVVTGSGFWFTASPRASGWEHETRVQYISDVQALFDESENGALAALPKSDERCLMELYEEEFGEEEEFA